MDYKETSCDHGYFTVHYCVGDGDLCVKEDECPVCKLLKELSTELIDLKDYMLKELNNKLKEKL